MDAGAEPLVSVRGAALAYHGKPVLDGLDCAIRAGETLALLGPNGAGKTTLMRLVAGRLTPDRGSVRIAGADPHREPRARRSIGWVPQEIALYPRLTAAENLGVFAQLAGIGRRERPEAVRHALDLAGIAEVASRPVGLLSGGYQRRVNIAASLIGRPRLVLLDEPTQGVDLNARAAIHAVLARLRAQGTAILIATHDFAEAERLADRVAFLARGRIVREGALPALLARVRAGPPEHEVGLAHKPDPAAESALRGAGFAPADTGLTWRAIHRGETGLDGAALLTALRGRGVPASEVRIRAPGLEALYRDALAPEVAA
ncbi:ABC transporter ATP-binding protein [Methylobacterium iners]|jgi:ABC-2 type transport system ATP-binding protein|uniref:Vitamin B12 import ATP-binding protein BtuD n=1 Tax=Methylobacterium iners TaxID=418707 RepID=A0ABQ4S293_9HYPH|nr:ABC transporter ATP-binding protein [Methylobacterium iners]GJD97251.1 Vitamin B12 import ATP-binding protein BtuD [Methylobacterium iners]